jgi:hypothetical protein
MHLPEMRRVRSQRYSWPLDFCMHYTDTPISYTAQQLIAFGSESLSSASSIAASTTSAQLSNTAFIVETVSPTGPSAITIRTTSSASFFSTIPSTRCRPIFYQAFLLGPYSYLCRTISKNWYDKKHQNTCYYYTIFIKCL